MHSGRFCIRSVKKPDINQAVDIFLNNFHNFQYFTMKFDQIRLTYMKKIVKFNYYIINLQWGNIILFVTTSIPWIPPFLSINVPITS